MESAIEILTKNLENGGYFRQANPKDFDAEDFFKGFDDKRRARAVWTTTVIPRLISSKHPTLQRTGVALQRKWNSKSYRKRLNQALEQEEIVLSSVHKHQTRVLDHSYKDLCHILKKREASFNEAEDSTGHRNSTESNHIGTEAFGQNSATVGEQAYDGPPSDSLVSETVIDRALLERTSDTIGQVSEVQDDNDETGNEIGDDTDDLSLPLFTDEDRKTLADTYLHLPDNKVTLPSGKVLEDILFSNGVTRERHHLMHSYIIDVDDAATKDMFTPADWAFITKEQEMSVSLSDQDVAKILERFRRADSIGTIMTLLQERHPRLGKGFVMERDYDLKWIFDSISRWLDLYSMPFSVFTSDAPLEYFWRSQVWGALDTMFFDISNTLMIGGESSGLDSTERRNQQQHGKTVRKLVGSKSDGYLRMFGTSKSDWMSIEGAKNWDPFAKKYKHESAWKIGRQLHDIFRARTTEKDQSTIKHFRTYGLIFG
ncbi:hypothetical protein BGZ67_009765, partial [Mortierella alpina]